MSLSMPAVDLSIQKDSGIKVKSEKQDDEEETKEKNASEPKKPGISSQQLSELQSRNITITVSVPSQPEKNTLATAHAKTAVEAPPAKAEPPPIDYSSICGAFGWITVGSVHLPFIMRGEDKFVSVRMIESKIINVYANILPKVIFQCTNINSYYITDNEAKLLNEINSFHCDYQFGGQNFSTQDVVVRLKDTERFYEFLETCKAKLNIQGFNPVFSDHCGFFLINYAHVPYIKKGTKKYISLHMVYPDDVPQPATRTEAYDEWDLAYLKFLSFFVSEEEFHVFKKFKLDMTLCSIDDLENALGGVHFEETWPAIDLSSKQSWAHIFSSTNVLSKWEEFLSTSESASTPTDNSKKLREKFNKIQEKESMLNSYLSLNNFLDMSSPIAKATHISRSHEQTNNLSNIQNSEKASIFPVSLENFLATSSYNYPYPVNYHSQYSSHMQSPILDYDRYRKSEVSVPSLPSSKSRSFPPPPPLVKLGNPRINTVDVPKATPALYPYLPPPSNAPYPTWLTRMFEPDWLHEEDNRALLPSTENPENLSRRFAETDAWCRASLSANLNGAGSSNIVQSGNKVGYDLSHGSFSRDDRILNPHGGSPRLLTGPGPPPHYPTPPQSSPLQPLSILDCTVPELYTRSTPNGLVDLCSPPPSPEVRSALSGSPRTAHMSGYGYQPHITRLVQVDSRYILAINVEPLKYNSLLAIPLSEVVNKLLRESTVQSCQIILETVFGLHLYKCTNLQQEAFAKHNLPIMPGSKMISLTDLKSCLYQLKFLLIEREKRCDLGTSELPLPKRWCGNVKEC